MRQQRFGKYRARVVDLNDPEKRGRIRVECPLVMNEAKSPWCEVCSPVAYEKGGDFCLPKIGDTVWIEFEEGNPERPVWVGNWWSVGNTPLEDYSTAPKMRIIEYDGCRIEIQEKKMVTTWLPEQKDNCFVELSEKGIKMVFKNSSIILDESITLTCGITTVHLDSSGNISMENNLKVSGNSEIGGNEVVTGNSTVGGNQSVSGSHTASSQNIQGNSYVGSLTVSGSADIGGNLTAGGVNMNTHTHHVSAGEVDTDTSTPQ